MNSISRRALLSVSDKTGIADFARRLKVLGFELISTGGTAALLAGEGIPVTAIADFTAFPEIMDGRVKTLHPRIHGALLGRRGLDDMVMAAHGIQPIELLVVNLYPFADVVRDPACSLAQAIENIDIGGPAMVRAAAKNHASVAVVTSPDQYAAVLQHLESGAAALDADFRFQLAVAAFNCIAAYDAAISEYLSAIGADGRRSTFPGRLQPGFERIMDLRYGENPHQHAAWYRDAANGPGTGLSHARLLQGKPLSYNNIADADAAWATAALFDELACVIVKHGNPCGVALGQSGIEAYEQAYATDPTSAFGGIIAFNRELDAATAQAVIARQFVELMMAPAVALAAIEVLAARPDLRVLAVGTTALPADPLDFKRISGGLLVQTADLARITQTDCHVVSSRHPTAEQWRDLLFAWNVAHMVKSNAIVYARDRCTLGIGAGQMSRIDAARIASWKAGKAGLSLQGSVMASDAFFPFRDSIDAAAATGIDAVIHPGGSKRDTEVIAAADLHGLSMVFTGIRHFRH